ncbi:NEQ401 [Nanoarchaeum equitans Kin4-M]|uniref:NEQ401 n=1 Tax=Nanoarchaeum equitans (strain Kin4-M) TaxID=228908 RepID=Q74N18_NANEQ|nr:NEQ401 [Nanoarchaeum equitans Kin4-M]
MSIFKELSDSLKQYLKEGKDPFPDIIGNKKAKEDVISCLLSGRHFLIIGPPGIGKTTLAKSIAKILPPIETDIEPYWLEGTPFPTKKTKKKKIEGIKRFVRIQGSPDLNPEDIVGTIDPTKALKYGISIESFVPGKIFRANRGVLFFDEINRAPPKIQNLLLQALEEGYVSLGPFDIDVPTDFIFIATMNPKEYEGTTELSEALMDRLDIIYLDYPETLEIEKQIVLEKGKKLVLFPDELLEKMLSFIRELRNDENLEIKPSPRASIGIYERAQAYALIRNSKKVEWQDIERAFLSVLPSRIKLKPHVAIKMDEQQYIKQLLDKDTKKKL